MHYELARNASQNIQYVSLPNSTHLFIRSSLRMTCSLKALVWYRTGQMLPKGFQQFNSLVIVYSVRTRFELLTEQVMMNVSNRCPPDPVFHINVHAVLTEQAESKGKVVPVLFFDWAPLHEGPRSFLSNGYQRLFPWGVKRPGREADQSPPSSTEIKECVELYLHSLNTPSWRGA
jgi:hypothetical protein